MSGTLKSNVKKKSKKGGLPPRPSIRIRDVPSKANPTPVNSSPVDEDDDVEASLEELFLEDRLTEKRLV